MRTWQTGAAILFLACAPACTAANGGDQAASVRTGDQGVRTQSITTHGHGPTMVPNGQRYKDTGAHPTTGRSGSAVVTARALLGKDGMTDIETSTGALDSTATPPGNISKVQLKIADASGNVVVTRNDNHLSGGGYVDERAPSLQRGQLLQVQNNADGIDNGTDVVTSQLTVKLRPDLAASDVRVPKRTWQNSSTLLGATVRELNGDVGATADCLLTVDGTLVDQAMGIWVDAGGTVSCRFQYRFPTLGTHAISVTVGNVRPGDWDLSNNTVSGSIDVVAPVAVDYSASAQDEKFHVEDENWNYDEYKTWLTVLANGTAADQWSTQDSDSWSHSGQDGEQQSAQFDAWFGLPVSFPLTTLTLTESSAGTPVGTIDVSGQPADFTTTWSYLTQSGTDTCIERSTGSESLFVCSESTTDSSTNTTTIQTHVQADRYAGDVTYYSYDWSYWYESGGTCFLLWAQQPQCYSSTQGPYYYSYNDSGESSSGAFVPMSTQYEFDLALNDDGLQYAPVSASIALTPFSQSSQSPDYPGETCNQFYWSSSSSTFTYWWTIQSESTYGYYCYLSDHTSSGVAGAVSGEQSSAPSE